MLDITRHACGDIIENPVINEWALAINYVYNKTDEQPTPPEPEPDYYEVEYVESAGDCHIDLGIKPSKDLIYSIDFAMTDITVSEQSVMGGSEVGKRTLIGMNYSYLWHQLGEDDWMQPSPDLTRHTASSDPDLGRFFLDAASRGIPQGDTYADLNLYLFAENYGGTASNHAKAKVFSLTIEDGGTEHRFIPVRRTADDMVCLYDEANETYYEPVGGSLIAGPDKN